MQYDRFTGAGWELGRLGICFVFKIFILARLLPPLLVRAYAACVACVIEICFHLRVVVPFRCMNTSLPTYFMVRRSLGCLVDNRS